MKSLKEYSRRRCLGAAYKSRKFNTLYNIGPDYCGLVMTDGVIQQSRINEVDYGLTVGELFANLTDISECLSYESESINRFLSYTDILSDIPFQEYALEDKQFKHIRG